MATEVERKFLVGAPPDGLEAYSRQDLQQGYLAIADDGSEARVRRSGDTCSLTVKQGKGLARGEQEIAISSSLFESLWLLTTGCRIEKTRYLIPAEEATIELDCYGGDLAGFIVAEVEFPSKELARAWTPPGWLGRDVTEDCGYKNQQLALRGRPSE